MGYMLVRKKNNNLSPTMYVSDFLTKGKISQNLLQLLTNYYFFFRSEL